MAKLVPCRWNGGACERDTDHESRLCLEHRSVSHSAKMAGKLVKQTEQLLKTLKDSPDFDEAYAATTGFIISTFADEHLLGDGDLMGLAVRAGRSNHKNDAEIKTSLNVALKQFPLKFPWKR